MPDVEMLCCGDTARFDFFLSGYIFANQIKF